FVAGLHVFLRWLFASMRPASENGLSCQWPLKRTLCGMGILFCALLSAVAILLTTHQVYWFSRSSEAWFDDPVRLIIRTRMMASRIKKLCGNVDWNRTRVESAFWEGNCEGLEPSPWDSVQPVWNDDSS